MGNRTVRVGLGIGAILLACVAAAADIQPVTLEDFQKFYPKVEGAANAALVYQKALDARVMGKFDRNLPLVGDGKGFGIPALPLTPEVKEGIAKELENNAATMQLVHQAGGMPLCRFPIDLTKGPAVELPHLAAMRDLARHLELQAVYAADEGKAELAVQSVLDAMALAHSLRKEPLVISQLVRIACWGIAIDSLEQVVNRIPLSDEALRQCQEFLGKADDRDAMTRAFQGELCTKMNLDTLTPEDQAAIEEARAEYEEKMQGRETEEEIQEDSGSASDEQRRIEAAEAAAVPNGNAEETQEKPADGQSGQEISPEEKFARTMELARTKVDPAMKEKLVREAKRMVDESRLPYPDFMKLYPPYDPAKTTPEQFVKQQGTDRESGSPLRRAIVSAARNAGKASAAQGAMAVERYRLKNGKLPDNWDDMMPDILAAPVPDPFVKDGAVLIRDTDAGYVVYSVGQNGKDDGGTEGDGRPPIDHVFRVQRAVPAGK